jgi:drug/metabolite transporter (DMT)-like permease
MTVGSDLPDAPVAPHHHHRHGLMHALMLVGTFFWASNIIAGKIVLRSMPPIALAQVRVTGAAAVFLAMFALGRRRHPLNISAPDLGYLAITAVFGITLNQIFFIGGIARTSAAHAGLIVALGPVMVLILASAMRLEPLTALKVVGAVVSLGGVVVLTAGKPSPGSNATPYGDAIMLLGTAVFAYYTILLKKVADRWDAVTLNAVIFVLGATMMLPFSVGPLFKVPWQALPADAWWCIAFIVACGSVLAYLIYAFALTELTASRVAAFNYLQPVIAAALGVWLLSEGISGRAIAGGALILLGVYLTEREGKIEQA